MHNAHHLLALKSPDKNYGSLSIMPFLSLLWWIIICLKIVCSKITLRSDSDFTFDHTRTAICDAIIDGVTFEKSENIFKHCGYIH